MRCPQVKIEAEDRRRFLKDPGVLLLEVLFGFLSVGNVLILYYLMSVVIPFPITVTWFQFAIGLLYARVLGECGTEFPNLAYFVPLRVDWKQMTELAFPTIAFIAMIVLGNIMLSMLPAVALFPVAASFAVCSHHFTRFLGCGQIYRPIRWVALLMMLVGFVLSCFDNLSVGARVVPIATGYAIAAATYRGCFLEKAMHTVRGLGNNLHNQQTMAGVILLPLLIAVTRERRFFTYMPDNFGRAYTWLMWGCLATAAVLPFIKNIVANRLIKIGGQPPWRIIELASMACIFLLGFLIFDRVSALGLVAFIFVLSGRAINSMDALSVDAQVPNRPQYSGPGGPASRAPPSQKEATHAAAPFTDSEGDFVYHSVSAQSSRPGEHRGVPMSPIDSARARGDIAESAFDDERFSTPAGSPTTATHSKADMWSGGYGSASIGTKRPQVHDVGDMEVPSGGIPGDKSGGIQIDL